MRSISFSSSHLPSAQNVIRNRYAISLRALCFFAETSPKTAQFLQNIPQGAVFVDLGCGFGDLVTDLTQRGVRAIGLDIQAEEIKLRRTSHQEPPINLMTANIYLLPFKSNSIDYFFSSYSVFWHRYSQYLEDESLLSFFKKMADCLKPNGVFYLYDLSKQGAYSFETYKRLISSAPDLDKKLDLFFVPHFPNCESGAVIIRKKSSF